MGEWDQLVVRVRRTWPVSSRRLALSRCGVLSRWDALFFVPVDCCCAAAADADNARTSDAVLSIRSATWSPPSFHHVVFVRTDCENRSSRTKYTVIITIIVWCSPPPHERGLSRRERNCFFFYFVNQQRFVWNVVPVLSLVPSSRLD